MTTIIDPTATFEDAKELIAKIETNWESVKLPQKLVSAFICAWEKYTGHPALRATGMTRLHTSSDRSENIADVDLSLGIAVSPLRALLHGYKKTAKDIAARSSVDAFLVEYKSKVQGTPACWPELESAIDSSSDVTSEEKALLKSFLTDSEKFYDIKGITRDDFATPALCRASGKRVDRFSIIDQIAGATNADPNIYKLFVEFIAEITNTHNVEEIDKLLSEFTAICGFCESYEAKTTPIKTSDSDCRSAIDDLKNITEDLEREFSDYRGIPLDIKYSKGSGNFPRVPWICILPPDQSPSSGVYFSICFGREGNGAVAGFAESVQNRGRLQTKARNRESEVINVNGGDPKQHYNNTYENPLEILKESFSYEDLKEHIRESLDRALEYLEIKQSHTLVPFTTIPEELSEYTICESILSKPFTILTGASGTGKTKLATTLATYLSNSDRSNSETIAVGADWTDNRSVLGFVNHLRLLEGKPSYQSTPILDLILRSKKYPESPHFLILDEMNLSHVERYFSDFLSTMEQIDGSLELHKEGEDKLLRFEGDELKVPHRIEYPKNLFVIGTVNIDETTYMFSPKVLDRANVIEFTVSEGEIGEFLKDPQPYQEIEPAEPSIAEGFLELAKQAQNGKLGPLPEANNEAIAAHMLNLFKILKDGRFEFAYRTAKEVNTYLRVCRHLADDSDAWDAGTWNEDLDDQILQKLLPKLHGSMGRIGGLLAALAAYCYKGAIEAETAQALTKIQLDAALQFNEADAAFPKSLKKLQAMIQTLRDEQFVSFIQ